MLRDLRQRVALHGEPPMTSDPRYQPPPLINWGRSVAAGLTDRCPHTDTTQRLDRTWRGRPTADRCLACGHRSWDYPRRPPSAAMGYLAVNPARTRSAPSRWLTELPRRVRARRMGRRRSRP